MDRHDILVWSDGYWCSRWESAAISARDNSYRVIPENTAEWHEHQIAAFPKKPAAA